VNTEADTCRKFVVQRLQTAGWEGAPHAINKYRTFADGRVIFVGGKAKRGRQKRADYILGYRADYPIAVVEAKAAYKSAADGLQPYVLQRRTKAPMPTALAWCGFTFFIHGSRARGAALISPDRPMTHLRGIVRNRLPARCDPSTAE
jgi:hypothetical protein